MRDIKDNTFTIVGQDMTKAQFAYAIEHHINKIQWKYPNFKIEVAYHNVQLLIDYQNSKVG